MPRLQVQVAALSRGSLSFCPPNLVGWFASAKVGEFSSIKKYLGEKSPIVNID